MGYSAPGPLCSSQLGHDWIDDGTLCRSLSGPPGPLGVVESFVAKIIIGATPQQNQHRGQALKSLSPEEQKVEDARVFFEDDIDTIRKSDFGATADGQAIISLLKQYLKKKKIVFAPLDTRGAWDQAQIMVNEDYYWNAYKTIVELVHEASHAIWRSRNPISTSHPETTEEGAKNEYFCVKNQLAIYKWLLKKRKCAHDEILDRRLKQEEDGTLYERILGDEEFLREKH